LLLKDIKTGRFLRAQASELEYVTIPEEEGTEVTFALKQAGEATLSYLIQGITWSPRYNLKVQADLHTFEAWADMTNDTKRDYKIKHTELFGGDVTLQARPTTPMNYCMARCCCCDSGMGGGAPPSIQAEGELAGLYWYSIDQPFVLVSQSTFSLPFVEAKIKMEKYAGLELYFQERTQRGKFQRKYRIESDKFLPKGCVTVREDGRVVGQAQVPDMGIGDKQDLDCGNDPDVSYHREVKVTSQKRDGASYEIRLTLKNAKQKPIKFEYKEVITAAKFVVSPKGDNAHVMKSVSDGLHIHEDEDLPPNNQERVFEYDIHLDYRTHQT